jgi:diketogulonate reductase-like aldo/keto reductase
MQIPSIIFGTFQHHNEEVLHTLVDAAYEHGIIGFDTSPSYQTEEMLGNSIKRLLSNKNLQRNDIFIQDKIDGWQMEESKGNITKYVDSSLQKLKSDYIDVLLIHWPFPDFLEKTWIKFLELKEKGKIKYIGLSNVRERHVNNLIKKTGIIPDVIQIERHPLRTCLKDIDFFHSQNIKVQAYSPICRMDNRLRESVVLNQIAEKYNKSISQIILRWHIDTNVIPVFMTSKITRIKENIQIFDIKLTQNEIMAINALNINYKIFVESTCCPGI